MTRDHHAVRNFVVDAITRTSVALSAHTICAALGLPLSRVRDIIAELHHNLFFLVRQGEDDVLWAFPVTAERTDHRIRLSTGERVFAACAEDAIAVPFVLSRLRSQPIAATVESRCRHCRDAIVIDVNGALEWQSPARSVLLFEPTIDWSLFRGESIVHDY